MKKILLLTTILFSIAGQAQIKEGYTKFKMELVGARADDLAGQVIGGTTMTIYFKKDRSLSEMTTLAYNMRTLTDSKGTLMLMDGAGQKVYSKKTKEELEKAKP